MYDKRISSGGELSLTEVLMWYFVQIHAEGTIDDVFSHVRTFLDNQLG